MPGIGMESEFNVWLDEVEIDPKAYFRHPSAFIDRPLLPREKSSLQLPTGGAVYFDRGVIEVVTPVIELAPHSTARMVRNLWEQIGFVREQLTRWEKRAGHIIRLKAYSSHYTISYEMPRWEQSKTRNEKALALLLAYILPVPVMLVGANRRSTGIGVRPRGKRIEVTADFTPDPGLMIATATLIVGIVREVMTWPTYDLSILQKLPIPVIAGVVPGKHTTRKGWLTKDFHYPQSPYTADIDAPIWTTQFGQKRSLRQIGRKTAWYFRRSIRKYSDPFSFRLLFAVLEGRAPSLLELIDRPTAYEDVGHLCRWGSVIHELTNYDEEMALLMRRWEQAKAGEGQIVLVSGEPGVGKTRLVAAAARHQPSGVHVHVQQRPHAVQLRLEPPAGIVEGLPAALRHHRNERGRDPALIDLLRPGQEHQPVGSGLHEVELGALVPPPVEPERHLLVGPLQRVVGPGVEDPHRPGAVVALRDQALERRVLHGMVLDVHGQPAVALADRQALGHGQRRARPQIQRGFRYFFFLGFLVSFLRSIPLDIS